MTELMASLDFVSFGGVARLADGCSAVSPVTHRGLRD
jgi:hypothetical protein